MDAFFSSRFEEIKNTCGRIFYWTAFVSMRKWELFRGRIIHKIIIEIKNIDENSGSECEARIMVDEARLA